MMCKKEDKDATAAVGFLDENKVPLGPAQMLKMKYPPGSAVVYTQFDNSSDVLPQVVYGTVASSYLDIETREGVYKLQSGQLCAERDLQFGRGQKVWVLLPLQTSYTPSVVLQSHHASPKDTPVFSVQVITDDKNNLQQEIHHSIPLDSISARLPDGVPPARRPPPPVESSVVSEITIPNEPDCVLNQQQQQEPERGSSSVSASRGGTEETTTLETGSDHDHNNTDCCSNDHSSSESQSNYTTKKRATRPQSPFTSPQKRPRNESTVPAAEGTRNLRSDTVWCKLIIPDWAPVPFVQGECSLF